MTDQARIAELEAENAYLRALVGLSRDGERLDTLRQRLGVSPNEGRILLALYAANGRFLTSWQLHDGLPKIAAADDSRIKTYAYTIRQKLGRDALRSAAQSGYALTTAGLWTVRSALAVTVRAA